MSSDVAVDVNAGVAILTLNRPEHLNAYTAEMGALLSADHDHARHEAGAVMNRLMQALTAG